MHQKGDGVERSIWDAIKLFEQSAECGYKEAWYTKVTEKVSSEIRTDFFM